MSRIYEIDFRKKGDPAPNYTSGRIEAIFIVSG